MNNRINSKLSQVWQQEIVKNNPLATPQQNPKAFVLGGQPGAGKSRLINKVGNEFDNNIIVINGDDFRKYHPHYKEFQEKYKQDSPKHTAEFAGKMTEAILNKAIKERYNIVIEGTFRTATTPIKTLQLFKDNGYTTGVLIQICDKEVSWASCLERFEKMNEIYPKEARFTAKEHHDNVVANLAENIKKVQQSGLSDSLEIYARIPTKDNPLIFNQLKIYDSKEKSKVNTATINRYLGADREQENSLGYEL